MTLAGDFLPTGKNCGRKTKKSLIEGTMKKGSWLICAGKLIL